MMAGNSAYISRLNRKPAAQKLIRAFPAAVLLMLMITLAANSETTGDRLVMVRYFNFILCGFLAFVIPHLQFPDSNRFLIQSLNLNSRDLLTYIFRSYAPFLMLVLGCFTVLCFWDPAQPAGDLPGKALIFVYGVIFAPAMTMTALLSYLTIGKRSQDWQEGERGARFMDRLKSIGQIPSIPPGGMPSILATVNLTAVGMLLVVAGAYLSGVTGTPGAELLPGMVLLLVSTLRFLRCSGFFDRLYYHTNAFYYELFLNPKAMQDGREPIACDALYWVPSRWKPAAWFSLLQLDRKLPMGRLMIVAHLALWVWFYAGLADPVISAFLGLIILGKCMALILLISGPFAPLIFQYRLLRPADWIAVRFFVNLRWVPLLVLSLWIVSLFTDRVGADEILFWAAADIGASFLTAALFTILHEFRIKKIYA